MGNKAPQDSWSHLLYPHRPVQAADVGAVAPALPQHLRLPAAQLLRRRQVVQLLQAADVVRVADVAAERLPHRRINSLRMKARSMTAPSSNDIQIFLLIRG